MHAVHHEPETAHLLTVSRDTWRILQFWQATTVAIFALKHSGCPIAFMPGSWRVGHDGALGIAPKAIEAVEAAL